MGHPAILRKSPYPEAMLVVESKAYLSPVCSTASGVRASENQHQARDQQWICSMAKLKYIRKHPKDRPDVPITSLISTSFTIAIHNLTITIIIVIIIIEVVIIVLILTTEVERCACACALSISAEGPLRKTYSKTPPRVPTSNLQTLNSATKS